MTQIFVKSLSQKETSEIHMFYVGVNECSISNQGSAEDLKKMKYHI